jgi:metal-responsive CopG/Arc/MetJ family transcriptional regulator
MGELKNKERFSTTLSPDLLKKLREYSEESMIPISKIINAAIQEYLSKHGK